jgi:hypothetical protein
VPAESPAAEGLRPAEPAGGERLEETLEEEPAEPEETGEPDEEPDEPEEEGEVGASAGAGPAEEEATR